MDTKRFNVTEGDVLIAIQDVHHSYGHGSCATPALRGVSLEIARGEFVAVWGPSGSGKTTLCNLIGTIDIATTGGVRIAGEDPASMHDDARTAYRNRTVGFIFQQFHLIPVFDARENVMLPLLLGGTGRREASQRAQALLEELGIGTLWHHRPDQLSGGQRQRVATARALIHNPALVIADEPTANLDSSNASRIVDMMLSMNASRGVTFVFSTHDERLLQRVSRRIELHDGRIASDTGGGQAS